MTQAVAEIEVFSEVISDNTPQHTRHKKSHSLQWLFMKQIKYALYSASLKTAIAPINFPSLSVSGATLESTSFPNNINLPL